MCKLTDEKYRKLLILLKGEEVELPSFIDGEGKDVRISIAELSQNGDKTQLPSHY